MDKLIITIDTNEPIPIDVFNKSLSSLSSQYKSITNKSNELYISKIKEGSYIIEVIEQAVMSTLPLIGSVCTIVQFIEYLKITRSWLLGKIEKPKSISISKNDLMEYKDLLAPAMVVNNYATMNFYYNQEESVSFEKDEIQTITRQIEQQQIEYKEVVQLEEIKDNYSKVLFYWFQTRFDENNINQGNKGIIETIDEKPKNVIFADDESETKKEMTTIHPDLNIDWQKIGYIVDVEVVKKGSEIKAYKIIKNYMNDCIVE